MIVDSSALMAVVLDEPDAARMLEAMLSDPHPQMSAANWVEAAIIVDSNRDTSLRARFDQLHMDLRLEIVPVSPEIALAARNAHQRFGRGHHSARLNYGDCFAYATASVLGQPLLFKGNDLSQTGIAAALPL